jgi:hypothetical protein
VPVQRDAYHENAGMTSERELSPVGPIEELLVDRAVNTMWRLRRLGRAETALFGYLVGTDLVCELVHLGYPDPPILLGRALELRQLQDRRRNRRAPAILDAVTLAAGDTE